MKVFLGIHPIPLRQLPTTASLTASHRGAMWYEWCDWRFMCGSAANTDD